MADGQVVEQVADQIEEVAEVTRSLSGREIGFFFAGAGVGVAAGFAVGYFVMGKRLETKYEKIADEEITQMRDHYHQLGVALRGEAERRKPLEELVVERGYVSNEGVRREYTEAEQAAIDEVAAKHSDPSEEAEAEDIAASAVPTETVAEVAPPETQNVFGNADETDDWDYAEEASKRERDVPYIIHVDEFRQNEPSHEQVTLTYYEQDDILADSRDTTVDDMDEVVGLGNLGRWGHGSNDPNITYVRNEEMKLDVEILRDRGSFHETVHAIRHSSERRRSSSRGFDDD